MPSMQSDGRELCDEALLCAVQGEGKGGEVVLKYVEEGDLK